MYVDSGHSRSFEVQSRYVQSSDQGFGVVSLPRCRILLILEQGFGQVLLVGRIARCLHIRSEEYRWRATHRRKPTGRTSAAARPA
ncbi:hypothetical protein LDENG_00138220 [Lucifuga dentata]|nr:hypothetical protein LDENG_00138220 [Lucifuga dentata]